jgi:hypothetical protein
MEQGGKLKESHVDRGLYDRSVNYLLAIGDYMKGCKEIKNTSRSSSVL